MNFTEYNEMIAHKLKAYDREFARRTDITNVIPKGLLLDEYRGGVRPRQFPMVGTDSSTFSPYNNAVVNPISGGKKKKGISNQDIMDFGQGFHDGFVGTAQMFGDAAQAVAPLAMLAAGKTSANELDKAKESLKNFVEGERKLKPSKKHIALLEKHGIISKKGANDEVEGGKVNRLKKAQKWTDFSANTLNTGLDLGAKGKSIIGGKVNRLKKAQKWTDFSANTLNTGLDLGAKGKSIFGGAKPQSQWVQFTKAFASKNGITYKEALSKAGPAYKQLKASGGHYGPAY